MSELSLARLPPSRFALLLLGLSFVLGLAGRGLQETYPVFVLPLTDEFGWSRAAISGVYATSFVIVGFSGPVIGGLYDRFGPFAVYAAGIASAALAAISATFCTEVWQMAASLGAMMGFGSACVGMVPFAALLSRWFHARLNLALAVAQSSYGAGILIMVPTAQLLIDWQGWRTAYWCFAVVLLSLLPLMLMVPWRRAAAGNPEQDLPPLGNVRAKVAHGPSLRQALFDPTFWGIIWGFTFTGIGMYVVSLQAPAYLVSIGYAPKTAASAYGVIGLLLPLGVIAFGWLCDRIGRRYTMAISYGSSILGVFALLGLGSGPSLPLLVVFVVCFGSSFGSRGPAFLTIAAHSFQGSQLGRITGALTIGMGGGIAIGSWLGGALLDLTGDYVAGLWCGVICLALAYLPYLAVAKMQRT